METYCISKEKDEKGRRVLHKLYNCNDFPFKDNRNDFLEMSDEMAINKAEQKYGSISRCPECIPEK